MEKLLTGSFREVEFQCWTEIISGGRKLAIYNIQDTNGKEVIDRGGLAEDISITASVSGIDYITKATELRRALNEEGEGDLVLPNLGLFSAKVLTWEETAGTATVGTISFSVSLTLLEMTGQEEDEEITAETLFAKVDLCNEALADAVERAWIKPKTNANRLAAAKDAKSALDKARQAVAKVNTAVRAVERAVGQINNAINNAELYADLFVRNGAFAAVSSAVGLGSSYRAVSNMVNFGVELPTRLQELGQRIGEGFAEENKRNFFTPLFSGGNKNATIKNRNYTRTLQVEAARFSATICMMGEIAKIDFITSLQAEQIKTELTNIFQSLTEAEGLINKDADFIKSFEDLLTASLGYLDTVKKGLFNITEIIVDRMPAFILSYALYGDKSKAEAIRGLNDGKHILDNTTMVLER